MSADETLLEKITSIIERDVDKIERKAKHELLDRVSAGNLVDYAKLQIAVDRHHKDLEEQAAKASIKADEYADLKRKAEEILKQRAGK